MPCFCSCPTRYPFDPERWCRACIDDYADYMDATLEQRIMSLEAEVFGRILAASDDEWQRRLDEIAPKVMS